MGSEKMGRWEADSRFVEEKYALVKLSQPGASGLCAMRMW